MKMLLTLTMTLGAFPLIIRAADGAGFEPGQLLAADGRNVYQVDLSTGEREKLWTSPSELHNIVYNPVSQSAFLVAGDFFGGSSIVELKYDAQSGFRASTFLDNLNDVHALAVNHAGTLFFDQEAFVEHRFWRATLDKDVDIATGSAFFVPQFAAFSPDESRLFVSNSPSPEVDAADFPCGDAGPFSRQRVAFSEGIDVAADGTVFVTEGDPGEMDGIRKIDASGNVTTYAEQPWMAFLGTGFWNDLEYDDRDGAMYVGKGGTLHKLDAQLNHTVIFSDFGFQLSLDLIEDLPDVGVAGDTDGDGDVDLVDLNLVRNNFGTQSSDADTNADGVVDLNDLNSVRNNFCRPSGATAIVPEPDAVVIAYMLMPPMAGTAVIRWRRKKSQAT